MELESAGARKARRYRERLEAILRMQTTPDLEAAIMQYREELEDTGAPVDEGLLETVRKELAVEVESRVRQINDPYILSKARTEWYDEGRVRAIHWPALRDYLAERKSWDPVAVESIGRTSREVVARLGDPDDMEFNVRGLVVGYIQSGKTANMTAVIARAADAGYNLIVVLAGITDKLRHQTQLRLETDLYQRNPNNLHLLTRRNFYDSEGRLVESGDYSGMPARKLPPIACGVTMLAIIKKNSARLKRLIEDINMSDSILKNRLRMLVIDDEADQASPNAGRTDEDPTPTNVRIRQLINTLPAVSYVGYTATPFANVLINPWPQTVPIEGEDECYLEDLYPRDFIISLPRPEHYFGAEEIFGRDPADAGDEGADGLDVVRKVASEELSILKDEEACPTLSELPGLRQALLWYLLSISVRLARGDSDTHSSMLVHTSVRIVDHERLKQIVDEGLRVLQNDLSGNSLRNELRQLWMTESDKFLSQRFGNPVVTYEDVEENLAEAFGRIRVVVENSVSPERVSYDDGPSAWIVIGGNILSRGLTLEGLMVTYFARSSRQYDTLLQMGRWFGYREGYEDLVRLWMPDELQELYRQLALVEYELREEIEEYAQRKATPLDFAVRIRTLPGVQVTARNKMKNAVVANIDYRGQHLQTIRFPRTDRDVLRHNWMAGGRLLAASGISQQHLVEKVSVTDIIKFFEEYQVDPSHRELSSGWVRDYISQNRELLEQWSVVLVQPDDRNRPVAEEPLGSIKPRLIRRARLRGMNSRIADIKALMSRGDVLSDIPSSDMPSDPSWRKWSWAQLKKYREDTLGRLPLLLLYPVDRNSHPLKERGMRIPLDAVHDVLGVGIIFPHLGVPQRGRATRYIQVRLSPPVFAGDEEDNDNARCK